jgi:transcriptional regulator with XRE-family HTH domain
MAGRRGGYSPGRDRTRREVHDVTSRFGELLRRSRRLAGLTQEELAARSGVSGRTIRGLETGDRGNPRVGTVQLLADALGLAPDQSAELLALVTPDDAPPVGRTVPDQLTDAANRLATAVAAHWVREEERHQIHDPYPLPVRWRVATEVTADHWANVRRLPSGAPSEPLPLAGRLDQLAETYRRVPSGRLVVLGRAGAGKTALAVRLVLELLATRAEHDVVPVVFGLGSWDPTRTPLRDWLVDQLVRDHPGLAATGSDGTTLAAALVRSDLILPVLDGFDEMADGLRRAALTQLNATVLPLVLTSRPAEYATLADGAALTAAAVIELAELNPADVADYLRRASRRSTWSQVLDHLRDHPADPASVNLAAVLTAPLAVTLARAAYSDRDPAELLDAHRFPEPRDIEGHLLDAYLPVAYRTRLGQRPRWDPDRAQRWLVRIAGHLDQLGTRDLAWWQLGDSLRRRWRLIVVGLVVGLAVGTVDGLVITAITGVPVQGLVNALVIGSTAGLTFALAHGFLTRARHPGLEPSRMRLRWGGRASATRGRLGPRLLAGLTGGFVFGLVNGIGRAISSEPGSWLWLALGYALVFGLSISLVGWLLTRFEVPLETGSVVSPAELLDVNRANVVIQSALGGLVFGAAVELLARGIPGLAGPPLVIGLVSWLVIGLGYWLSLTAWGQWVIFARLWLPLTGRLPWGVARFLDDACHRGVLRRTGAVYQFRHARLQDHLTRPAAGR